MQGRILEVADSVPSRGSERRRLRGFALSVAAIACITSVGCAQISGISSSLVDTRPATFVESSAPAPAVLPPVSSANPERRSVRAVEAPDWVALSRRGREALREQRFREAEDYFRRALAVLGPASERDARREALYKNLVRLASILHRIERTDDAERVMGIVASHAQVEGRPAERQRDYRRLYDDLAERRLSPRMQPIQISGGTPRTGIDGLIQTAARTHRMDPALVKAVVAAESNFDSRAVSHAGALGLMQLMPETARELGVRAPFDPRQNIDGGTRYLRQMLDRFGEIKHALAAYNAGPDAVDRYGGVPPFDETREYVRRVLSFYQDFRAQFTR